MFMALGAYVPVSSCVKLMALRVRCAAMLRRAYRPPYATVTGLARVIVRQCARTSGDDEAKQELCVTCRAETPCVFLFETVFT